MAATIDAAQTAAARIAASLPPLAPHEVAGVARLAATLDQRATVRSSTSVPRSTTRRAA